MAMSRYDVPYLGSFAWYRLWTLAQLEGATPREAAEAATLGEGLKPKDFTRTRVEGAGGAGEVLLTVPVCGGASVAKRGLGANPEVSGHGRWEHVHAGALEAAYGRTPYAPHFLAGIKEAILRHPHLLADLNFQLHSLVITETGIERMIPRLASLREAGGDNPQSRAALDLGSRIRSRVEEEGKERLSLVGTLLRFGPDTLFALAY